MAETTTPITDAAAKADAMTDAAKANVVKANAVKANAVKADATTDAAKDAIATAAKATRSTTAAPADALVAETKASDAVKDAVATAAQATTATTAASTSALVAETKAGVEAAATSTRTAARSTRQAGRAAASPSPSTANGSKGNNSGKDSAAEEIKAVVEAEHTYSVGQGTANGALLRVLTAANEVAFRASLDAQRAAASSAYSFFQAALASNRKLANRWAAATQQAQQATLDVIEAGLRTTTRLIETAPSNDR